MSPIETIGSQPTAFPSHPSLSDRLRIDYLINPSELAESGPDSGQDVIEGLGRSPKSLPPHYFYDDRGSELFEQICDLPEYYLTRTERAILQQNAGTIAHLTGPCELVELGSGSSFKTRMLLDAYRVQGSGLRYLPIDVSAGILETSARQLLEEYPALQVHGIVSTYELALSHLGPSPLPTRMIAFLGSTLGNLTPQECQVFFTQIREALQPNEYFLLGVDLQKTKDLLEAAYNDRQGVTAQFNLNMLSHLNWRFDGDFDLAQFAHVAFYNETLHQIEIYLKSLTQQTVTLKALGLTIEFQPGEAILSEISRKFNLDDLQTDLRSFNLNPVQTWTDPKQWFGLMLCQAH
ncbi:MAG: L-histidine N(alpha)-methyltransferase [Leptolyngbyaceae cyanobacterium bins.59]|nr:L-histidine N(alpha)-methyltransferase [Leptolyngbyaceae cyanobacterium bins.59]